MARLPLLAAVLVALLVPTSAAAAPSPSLGATAAQVGALAGTGESP